MVLGDKEIDDAVTAAIASEDLVHWMRVLRRCGRPRCAD